MCVPPPLAFAESFNHYLLVTVLFSHTHRYKGLMQLGKLRARTPTLSELGKRSAAMPGNVDDASTMS